MQARFNSLSTQKRILHDGRLCLHCAIKKLRIDIAVSCGAPLLIDVTCVFVKELPLHRYSVVFCRSACFLQKFNLLFYLLAKTKPDFSETLISISKLRLSRKTLISFSISTLNFFVRTLILILNSHPQTLKNLRHLDYI